MLSCPRCRATYPDGTHECPDDKSTLLPVEAFAMADRPLEPGTKVGEYQIERRLGAGTFGEVYAGEQPLIGKRVAVKLLHQKLSSDPEVVSRFIAEARAVNRIRNKNIIDIFSFGLFEERRHYFVMELLDGLTLSELLEREGKLPLATALPILRGIAEGLDAAHEAGITHRDLKPDNVFLATEKGGGFFPKLLDFGVAKLGGEDLAHKTATGIAIGTPRYMSPEQCRGKKVDHRSDIYALGVLTFEMLTGQAVFEGESSMDVLFKHTTEPAPAMSSVSPELSPELDAPVNAMLAKQPSARPQSAGQAIAALTARAQAIGAVASDGAPASPDVASLERAMRRTEAPTVRGRMEDLGSGRAVVARTPSAQDPASGPRSSGGRAGAGQDTMSGATVAAHGAPEASDKSPSQRDAVSAFGATMLDTPASGPGSAGPISTLPSGGPASTAAAPEPMPLREASRVPPPPAQARGVKKGPPWIAIGIGAAALAVGALALTRMPGARSGGAETSATAAGSAAPTASAAASVTVRLGVVPADATVSLDGRPAGLASEPLVMARSEQSRALKLEKDGYEPQTLWVVPDRDKDLMGISLAPTVPAPAGASAAPGASGSSRGAPIAPKGGTGNKTKRTAIEDEIERPSEYKHPK